MKKQPTKPLGDVLEISRERIEPTEHPNTPFNYVGLESIEGHTGRLLQYEPTKGAEIKSTKNVFHRGEILYGKLRPYLNKVHLATEDGICSTDIYVLRPHQQEIHPSFVAHYLRSPSVLGVVSNAMAGANLPRIGQESLLNIPIPLPPLADQERIVKLLDEADELRKLRTQADNRTDTFISALFHEMFGGGKFKSARVGELTSLVTSGSTPRGGDEVYTNEGPYFIRSQNVEMNRLNLADAACLPADVHAQMKRTKVFVGDVLLNITGASIGRVTWVDKLDREANVSQHVCLIRPNSDLLNPTYLSVFISLPTTQRFILQIQAGASRQALNHQQVRTLEIPLPPISLQKEFSQRVTEIRELEASQSASRTRLDALFQSMLHRAFNGDL